MPDEDQNFRGSLVLDFQNWWRHLKTIDFTVLESLLSSWVCQKRAWFGRMHRVCLHWDPNSSFPSLRAEFPSIFLKQIGKKNEICLGRSKETLLAESVFPGVFTRCSLFTHMNFHSLKSPFKASRFSCCKLRKKFRISPCIYYADMMINYVCATLFLKTTP